MLALFDGKKTYISLLTLVLNMLFNLSIDEGTVTIVLDQFSAIVAATSTIAAALGYTFTNRGARK